MREGVPETDCVPPPVLAARRVFRNIYRIKKKEAAGAIRRYPPCSESVPLLKEKPERKSVGMLLKRQPHFSSSIFFVITSAPCRSV